MKTWIKTNLNKITLTLALIGAVSGVTGLIIGSLTHNQINGYKSYLGHDYIVYWGGMEQQYEKEKLMINT